ncbi:MAG: hypothetical protein SF172_03505 [Burkholderiales bacterium]|nr:hypothetical protein [Burkholderiales bacterium]
MILHTLHSRWILAFALLFFCGAALAQMPGGGGDRRGRGPGGMGEMPRREAGPRPGPPAAPVTDPLSAFERELPSLRMDLRLAPEQVANWDALARAIRDAAEANRGVARMAASLRLGEEVPPLGKALDALGALANQRAAALAEANRAHAALDTQLSTEQKSNLTRRFRQALMEPLGP